MDERIETAEEIEAKIAALQRQHRVMLDAKALAVAEARIVELEAALGKAYADVRSQAASTDAVKRDAFAEGRAFERRSDGRLIELAASMKRLTDEIARVKIDPTDLRISAHNAYFRSLALRAEDRYNALLRVAVEKIARLQNPNGNGWDDNGAVRDQLVKLTESYAYDDRKEDVKRIEAAVKVLGIEVPSGFPVEAIGQIIERRIAEARTDFEAAHGALLTDDDAKRALIASEAALRAIEALALEVETVLIAAKAAAEKNNG